MIFIAAALYEEGKGFIEKYKLKKDLSYSRMQVFKNDEITLIICKSGMVQSAVNITEVFCREGIGSGDLFFNVGICGCGKKDIKKGEIFLINKITDMTTGKDYYSDILYRHSFSEGAICTFPRVVKGIGDFLLCDMECSALYQSAVKFFDNERIFFIKIVSDYCDGNTDIDEIRKIIENGEEKIFEWIDGIKNTEEKNDNGDDEEIEKLCNDMKFGENLKRQTRQLLMYYKYEGGNLKELIDEFKRENDTENIRDKREGKIYLERLRKRILQ